MAPTTPMAPASVGVASPMKIVPNTRKISPSDGIMPRRHFFHSAHPFKVRASIGKAGTALGQMTLTMATHAEQGDLDDAGANGAGIHVADGTPKHVGEHDQY